MAESAESTEGDSEAVSEAQTYIVPYGLYLWVGWFYS